MISVVIPAHNEEKNIDKCLDAIRTQVFKNRLEVIVVDNNSDDETQQKVFLYKKQYPEFDIHLIIEKEKRISKACQRGFTEARYPIIVRVDADSFPKDNNWLNSIFKHFQKPNVIAVGGVGNYENKILFTKLVNLLQLLHFNLIFPFFFGYNFAIRKDAFRKIGGFNINLERLEDLDISLRLKKLKKGKLVLDRNIIVNTSFRKYRRGNLSFKWLIKSWLNYFNIIYKNLIY